MFVSFRQAEVHAFQQGLQRKNIKEYPLLDHLSKVTAAQLQSVAQRYFGEDALTVVTLLPQKSK